ncbi:MAG TPA: PDZ domain-containing protein [Pyrinomonadaceae bacterium]|nr:PDZ domain-containing protein [Pyrinomonadaceae bacterium]
MRFLVFCVLALCSGAASGQTPAAAPAAPTAPAQAPTAAPAQPQTPPAAPARPAPPREVVTVVHRLSGWKLLAWLASSGPPALELDELPTAADAHTNIVAGYIYEDGRSVVTRLPQAEVELEGFPAAQVPFGFNAPAGAALRKPEPEYTLVTSDGVRVGARFVGLDAATGLTLLEADKPLLPGAHTEEAEAQAPAVGQRIRLYAPAPTTPPAPPAGVTPRPDAGRIYLNIDQREGKLTEVRRGPSGKPFRVVARADVTPEWTGAVAADESGEFVGIVAQSAGGEMQIVPLATVRSACDRVLKLRGTAPQPWLGARGDDASQAPLQTWVNFGWSQELARSLIEKSQGVFLTSVAPGTPAALAGLKPGDLIGRVGPREVRSVEDLSQTLKEAGVGSVVDFTVWRWQESEPVRVPVELKGTTNPALSTAFAEQRAAFERMSAVARERAQAQSELQQIVTRYPGDRARMELIQGRLRELKLKSDDAEEAMKLAQEYADAARGFKQGPALTPRFTLATPLQSLGLSAIGLTERGAARLGARGGMLVVSVRPETPAAAASLRAGDVIETVNGSPVRRFELIRLLATPPGAAPLTFGLVREGQRINVTVSPTPDRQ